MFQKPLCIYFIVIAFLSSNGASLLAAEKYNIDSIKNIFDDKLRTANLLPIGFSKNGLFAYAERQTNCECEGKKCVIHTYEGNFPCEKNALTHVIIVNMVNDQVIHPAIQPEKYHGYDKSTIDHFLAQHGLVQVKDIQLEQFPFSYNNNNYDIEIRKSKTVVNQSPIDSNSPREGLEFWIHSKELGRKKFYFHEVISEDIESGMEVGHKVIGFIQSPFENRIVVLIKYHQRMFEEEYRPNIIVSGVHLSKGFD